VTASTLGCSPRLVRTRNSAVAAVAGGYRPCDDHWELVADAAGRARRCADGAERRRLVSSARSLPGLWLGWHLLEAVIAIAAGVVAGSVALVGSGADSLVEAGAGSVVLWLVTGERLSFWQAERRAQQWITVSFVLLAVYVTVESAGDLTGGHHPATSWVGIGLSAVTLVTMRCPAPRPPSCRVSLLVGG
jgi:hypothetical protein